MRGREREYPVPSIPFDELRASLGRRRGLDWSAEKHYSIHYFM
jgi:hypothetical protein